MEAAAGPDHDAERAVRRHVQQQMWLVVARAGALAALVLAYRLAWRLEGPSRASSRRRAGLASAFATRMFRGDSEGLLVAPRVRRDRDAPPWAPAASTFGADRRGDAHAPGARSCSRSATGCSSWRRPPPGTARSRPSSRPAAPACVVVAAWLCPRRSARASCSARPRGRSSPSPGSRRPRRRPFVATFTNAALGPAVAAVRDGGRARASSPCSGAGRGPAGRLALVLAAMATATMAIVAAMAEGGFTGNIRYLTLPVALTCVLGGAGAVRLARIARDRLGRPARDGRDRRRRARRRTIRRRCGVRTADQVRGGQRESRLYSQLDAAIARAGGRGRDPPLRQCLDRLRVRHAGGRPRAWPARVPGPGARRARPGNLRAAPEPPAPGGPPLPARHAGRRLAHRVDLRHIGGPCPPTGATG